MPPIRIAHLSDLHASHGGAPARKVAAAAVEDLLRANEERPIDLVAFTGDLARTGRREEYELADEWLVQPLLDALDLDESRFFLVPGNHDVFRSSVNKYADDGLRSALTDPKKVSALMQDEPALAEAIDRLRFWDEYHDWLMDEVSEKRVGALGYTRRLEIDRLTVGVASLNTAWRSFDDTDRGHLLLGDDQVDLALGEIADCELRLVLMHHPFPWLASFDADRARARIEAARTLVLSGHDHDPDPTAEFSLRGGSIYSRAGCLYESQEKLNGYTIVDVDVDGGVVDFLLRTWFPERGEFDQATHLAADGKARMAWVDLPRLPARANYSVVLENLGRQAADLSVALMPLADIESPKPADVLVEPRLWPVPYKEIAAARDLDASSEPRPSDPMTLLDSSQVLLVVGEPESGVSGALLWTLAEHFEQKGTHTPFSTSLDRRHFKSNAFAMAIRQNAIAAGQHVSGKQEIPQSIIGVDDVADGQTLQMLSEFISLHGEHLFVLGCREDRLEAVQSQLSEYAVDFEVQHLGPLGRAQVRELIEKAEGLRDDDVDRIFGLIVNQHLPRTPFIIAALIVAIEQNQDPATFNESALLDACSRVMLGADEVESEGRSALEPIHREKLLAWFAANMTKAGVDHVPARECEEQFAEYFRERGWGQTITPGDVLSNLVERKMLIRDGDGVGFRHRAMQDLFAGKQLDVDPDFATELLGNPFAHRNAIRHAAGLRRDDLVLLESVGTRSAEVFAEADGEIDVELFDLIKDKPGWSDKDPSLDDLKRMLADRAEPPDETERDRRFDKVADDVEYSDNETAEKPPPLFATLEPAADLLSGVLRNSELVADVELKVSALKDAIHGWSLIALVMAVEEDQADDDVENVRTGEAADVVDADEESAARVAELMISMIVAVVVTSVLSSPKLEEVAREALDDDHFTAITAHALFATLFYVLMRFDGWDQRLVDLHERHGGHPIVKRLTFSLATSLFRSPQTKDAEADRLLRYLAHQVTPEEARHGGGVAARARARVLQDLKRTRQKSLMAGELGIDARETDAD